MGLDYLHIYDVYAPAGKSCLFRKLLPYLVISITATSKYGIPTSKCPNLDYFLFWKVTFHFGLVPVVSHDVPFSGEHSTACLDALAAVLKEI